MGKGVFLSLFGGGFINWGGCLGVWLRVWLGGRGVLRIVFLIPANPFQAQSVVL